MQIADFIFCFADCELQIANFCLKFPDTFSAGAAWPEIILVFKDESHDEVNDNRRTEGEEGEINKIHPDMRSTDSELFTPPGTYTISLTLKPKTDTINHLPFVSVKLQIFQ